MKKWFAIFIFSLLILTFYANFKYKQTSTFVASFAKPIFNINFSSPKIINNSCYSFEYKFNLSNFTNDTISDIPIYYKFSIINIPSNINLTILKNSTPIFLSDGFSEIFYLSNNTKQEDIFNISIKYIGALDSSINEEIIIELFYQQANFSNSIKKNICLVHIVPNCTKNNSNKNILSANNHNSIQNSTSLNTSKKNVRPKNNLNSKKRNNLNNHFFSNHKNKNKNSYSNNSNVKSDVFLDTNSGIVIEITK